MSALFDNSDPEFRAAKAEPMRPPPVIATVDGKPTVFFNVADRLLEDEFDDWNDASLPGARPYWMDQ